MGKSIYHRFAARYRKNKILSYLLAKTGIELSPKQWVFIVGCYNSGTTLLEQILSLHPEVSSLSDEGVILTGELNRPEDFGYNRVSYPVKDKLYIDPEASSSPKKAALIKRHWSHFYDQRKKVFVEKSIANAVRINFFDRFFCPAYFIYIVRNGYAVSEGIKRKANPRKFKSPAVSDYSLEMCAKQWRDSDIMIREYLIGKRSITISYEELTDETGTTVRKITDFLNLSPIPTAKLESSFSVHGSVSEIKNMNSASIKKLSMEEVAQIRAHAGDILKRYNY